MKDLSQILIRPIITEKTADLGEAHNKYAFQVATAANKHEIRQAVEKFFGVKVLNVRTMNMHGKPKRMGRFEGHRPDWKKAIVTLQADDTIDLFDMV
jgi:large subunit ribosomal protein L23